MEHEFRGALLIEANRFKDLQKAHDDKHTRLTHTEQALTDREAKLRESTTVIVELNGLVKTQQTRIRETARQVGVLTSQVKELTGERDRERDRTKVESEKLTALTRELDQLNAKLVAQDGMLRGWFIFSHRLYSSH